MTYKGEKFVDRLEAEQARLRAFEANGGLDRPAYALSPGMSTFHSGWLLDAFSRFGNDLNNLSSPERNATGYSPDNGYFDSPDSDVLYLVLRSYRPKRVVEVGCGHSTRVTRQAINDGSMNTELCAIDPFPRKDIGHLVDRFVQSTLETADPEVFDALEADDILFIDSSHQVRVSNDVAHLFCRILPKLSPGVLIHVHDVFLPYEYPKRFFYECPGWGEQYVLHALLQGGGYDVLWPGYYVQKERPELFETLPFLANGRAQSFWMRKR